MINFYIFIFILIYDRLECLNQSIPKLVKVSTSLGSIIGKEVDGINHFLGVPFAEPPIGRFRFHPSVPKRPWFPSTYQALQFSHECLQSILQSPDAGPRDEDCLYLNIWQPSNISRGVRLPVLLWIYGGGFLHGAASRPYYHGHKLAKQDVIVVSCNYRVGSLGFLVSTSDGLFGNYGLHDQKLAMEWVQDNIHYFQGDPNRVTLFGESAGAMSIGLHFLEHQYNKQRNRKHRKLFHQIILQSNPLGYKYRTVAVANFIGQAYKEQLDCEDLRCLQSEPPDELIHVQDTLMAMPRSLGDFFTWGPVVTDNSYYREARLKHTALSNIIVHQPLEAVRLLKKLNVPVVIGSTAHEGTVFVFSAFPGRMIKVVFQALVFSFFRTSAPGVLKTYSSLIQSIDDSLYPDYRIALSTIIGDYLFRCPTQLFANILANPPISAPIYLYEFALPTRTPGFTCCDGLSCHTSEIPYVFNLVDMIVCDYIWKPPEIDYNSALASSLFGDTNAGPSTESLSSQSSNPSSSSTSSKSMFTLPDIFGATRSFFHRKKAPSPSSANRDNIVNLHIQVSEYMSKYWVMFTLYGDPNGKRSNVTNHGYALRNENDKFIPFWPQLLEYKVTNAAPVSSDGYETIVINKTVEEELNSRNHSDSNVSPDIMEEIYNNRSLKEERPGGRLFDFIPKIFLTESEDEEDDEDDDLGYISNSDMSDKRRSKDTKLDWLGFQQGGIEIDFGSLFKPFLKRDKRKGKSQNERIYVEVISESQTADLTKTKSDDIVTNNDNVDDNNALVTDSVLGATYDVLRSDSTIANPNLYPTPDPDSSNNNHFEPKDNMNLPRLDDIQIQISDIEIISDKNPKEKLDENIDDYDSYDESDLPEIFRESRKFGKIVLNSFSKSKSPSSITSTPNTIINKQEFSEDVHIMVFDEISEINILSSDCVCKFWNNLDYRF